jgi:hypothetical protein
MDHNRPTWQPSDQEAYCYLKRFLPAGYGVQAEPSADYFTEWQFRYLVYHGEQIVAELAGDFREIRPGSLTAKVVALVERAQIG